MTNSKICPICGKEFIPATAWNVYCSKECIRIRACERVRESRARRKLEPVVVVAPKHKRGANYHEIADIAVAARKEGLSYGQYVAKYLYQGGRRE